MIMSSGSQSGSPQTSNISISWEPLRNSDYQVPLQSCWLRNYEVGPSILCFYRPSRAFWCTLKFLGSCYSHGSSIWRHSGDCTWPGPTEIQEGLWIKSSRGTCLLMCKYRFFLFIVWKVSEDRSRNILNSPKQPNRLNIERGKREVYKAFTRNNMRVCVMTRSWAWESDLVLNQMGHVVGQWWCKHPWCHWLHTCAYPPAFKLAF